MKRPLLTLLALFACVTAASLVRADAPPDQYEAFLRADTIIVDQKTGLVWDRRPLSDPTTGAPLTLNLGDAKSKCNGLAPARFSRLPTMKELLTLVDEDPHAQQQGAQIVYPTLDISAFPQTPIDLPYWSITDSREGGAMSVDFSTGKTGPLKAGISTYVRCVYNSK